MNNKNAREQIIDLLIAIERDKSYAQLALKEALKDTDSKDKPFITEVVYGTLKYQLKLDYIIDSFSKTPVSKMKPLIRNILRMGAYQMMYLDKIPVSAAINEAVKIVKKRKFANLSGFVNGVLRTIDRNKESIQYPDKEKELEHYLSVTYAIPRWIISEWLLMYSAEITEQIADALNKRAKVCIRVNPLHTTKEEIKHLLQEEHISCEEGTLFEEALYLKSVDSLQSLNSFKKGLWTVQDESAMLVAHVVNPKAGDKVLDMCSAPGGKSIHMAELMQDQGEIVSLDIHEHKLELIRQNTERMGIGIIKPVLWDGTVLQPDFVQAFDKVLLDAPCSGLGIIKRKPDIRYNKKPEDLREIAKLQRKLAEQAAKYVKEGGVLVYSTCTLSRQENQDMVDYITSHLGLELSDIVDTIPHKLKAYIKNKGVLEVLPFVADTDGFFIACFKKKRA
jgi:16S rRNA (cytosine967-C5)-methyltransferase